MRQVYVDAQDEDNEIEKIDFYSPSEGYVAFSYWIGFTNDSGRTFSRKYITLSNVNYNGHNVNLTFGFGIKGVKAFNKDTVIAYGHYGAEPAILYSVDQANSFTVVYHAPLNSQQLTQGVMDMSFTSNPNIGFALDADRIIKTTNKGISWTVCRSDPNSFFDDVQAVDNNTVYAYSTNYAVKKLLKSTNGGSSWQTVSLPVNERISSAFFLTASNGWLNITGLDNDVKNLYYTSNGGQSWTQKNNSIATPVSVRNMKFTNDSTGYALYGLYTVYKTTDSGKVWQPLPRDNSYTYLLYSHNDFQCLNNQLWAGGGHGFLELSTNAGGTPLPKAYFKVDTTNFYVAGNVNLINYSKPNYQYKWFNGDQLIGTAYHVSYVHSISKQVDTIKLIVSNGTHSDTLVKYQYFNVPPLPAIQSFSPAIGSTGTLITINGINFTGVSKVNFGGVPASSFKIESSTRISAVVANGATGNVSVTTNYYNYSHSAPGFVYSPPPASLPPVVTSLSPAFGPIGTIVKITGNNFAPGISSNIVYFGATKATVTSASATEVNCIVPAGASYLPVSVLNTNTHLKGQSFKPFNVTFSGSSNFTYNSFVKNYTIEFKGIQSSKAVESADVDGDGKTDLLYTYVANGDSLAIQRNITTGTDLVFEDKVRVANLPGGSFASFTLNDLDGDGKLDIISARGDIGFTAIRNKSSVGLISFEPQINFPGGGSWTAAVDDLDNDGRPDVVTGNKSISISRNTSVPGTISFASNLDIVTNDNTVSIATGDLDGDGKKEIVLFNAVEGASNFSVLKNTSTPGNISFATKITFTTTGFILQGRDIHLSDLDNDNKLDVIIYNDRNYMIFRNTSTPGNISFIESSHTAIAGLGRSSCIANFNGDEKPDFAEANPTDNSFTFYRNLSIPGTIINDSPLKAILGVPYTFKAHDFNSDGRPDIVASFGSIIYIYQNTIGLPLKKTLCDGSNTTITADIAGTAYKWQQDTGTGYIDLVDNSTVTGSKTNTLNFIKVPLSWNSYKYRCIVDSYKSSIFQLEVLGGFPQPTVTISMPATGICQGSPVTFTATATDSGDTPSYFWYINNTHAGFFTNTNQFTTSNLKNNDRVVAVVYASGMCKSGLKDTSNVITIATIGSLPTVTITGTTGATCVGSPVTFTATPTNEGTAPVYDWIRNGVKIATTTSNTYTSSVFNHGDNVQVFMTSNTAHCNAPSFVKSNQLSISRKGPFQPTAIIANVATTICEGTSVTFTAGISPAGTVNTFQWQVNGINVGTNSNTYTTSTLTNGSKITVIVTTNAECVTTNTATSQTITMTVNAAIAPAITISGTTTVNVNQATLITATTTNAGTTPAYQWQDSTDTHNWQSILGGDLRTINYTPAKTGDKIRCILTSNNSCNNISVVTSEALVFIINTVTAIDPVPASSQGIVYYPNPVTNLLTIDSLKISDRWETLEITSLNGSQKVLVENIINKTRVTVSVGNLASGLYIAILRRKSGVPVYLKFIKI